MAFRTPQGNTVLMERANQHSNAGAVGTQESKKKEGEDNNENSGKGDN